MNCLGIRCSNSDYSYVILSGTKQKPIITVKNHIDYPVNYYYDQSLKWFYQEVKTILLKNKINIIVIKGTEPMGQKGKIFAERTMYEAIIFLLAADFTQIDRIYKKTKPTIAKDLGLKGKASYIKTKLDCSPIPNFDKENKKIQEAILAAWSALN